jgi:glycosyltransferase involved in cell wall biosynthesis
MTTNKPLIAIFLPSLGGGGAERVMVTLANAFADRGFLVDLVLVQATGPYLLDVSSNVNIVDLGESRVLFSLLPLVRYLRSRNPTALLSAMSHANVVALLAKKLACVSTRFVASERINPISGEAWRLGVISFVIKLLSRCLYPTADIIHAVSQGVADASAKHFHIPRENIHVVYNPISTYAISDLANEPDNLSLLIPNGGPIIVAAGRLTIQKDFSTLIRAFALVRESVANARLVIMGQGNMHSELVLLADECSLGGSVLFPGFVDNPFAVMKRASLFVLSSAWEGLPNVLIQAMACGVPVVSTDCQSGPSEILEQGKWGRLVRVGDVQALSTAILCTLSDKEHPPVALRAADFSVDRAVDDYLKLLLPHAAL